LAAPVLQDNTGFNREMSGLTRFSERLRQVRFAGAGGPGKSTPHAGKHSIVAERVANAPLPASIRSVPIRRNALRLLRPTQIC